MARKKAGPGMEEMLAEVNQIIDRLQTGKLSFEENLAQYQKAKKMLQECSQKLDTAEKELIILEEDDL